MQSPLRNILALAACTLAGQLAAADAQSRRDIARLAELERQEPLWQSMAAADPADSIGCRQIMGYALALGETRRHPERLQRLFELLARMQDRDRQSRTFGNLKWRWGDAAVQDLNAVEFVLHDALLMWKRHRDWIPREARPELSALMRYSLEATRRHRVPLTYTNIALLRAANLIVLGEVLRRPEVAELGQQSFTELVEWTARHGIHECASPTYYSVDINALVLIARQSRNELARRRADALLRLLWMDIALNWFPGSERLSGATSRTYDHPAGRGALDWHLWAQGWIASSSPDKAARVEPYWDEWTPPADLHAMSVAQLPRLVRQSWGEQAGQSRTYMAYHDVGLSTLSAAYGAEDVPLAIGLPGPRHAPRGYFRADGRQDPYGVKRFAAGPGGQKKPNHLTPFWSAAQRSGDALVMAVFDANAGQTDDAQAHLVLPRKTSLITIGGKPVDASRLAASAAPTIAPGQPLVLRYGTATVGVRVLAASRTDGQPATVALVDDGNSLDCLRLTAELGPLTTSERSKGDLASGYVVAWVRVGSGLSDDGAFATWQKSFVDAKPSQLATTADRIEVAVPGVAGPLALSAAVDAEQRVVAKRIIPEPTRCILELDGQEVGQTILAGLGVAPPAGPDGSR